MKLSDFRDYTKVVIVDDKVDDGEGIRESLEKIGIASVFFHITSNRSLPKEPFKNIRIVFLDLIFNDSGSRSDAQNAGNALGKLSAFVSEKAFYVLVIWSGHTTERVARIFTTQLQRTNTFAKPSRTLILQKSDFMDNGKYDANLIVKEINSKLSEAPSFQVFSDWEKLTANSISNIASDIVAQKNHEDLSKTLNSLSGAYAGSSGHKKNKPKNALMALNEIFKNTASKEIMSAKFGNLYRKIADGNLTEEEGDRLNTLLMFSHDPNPGPGSIFKIRQYGPAKKKFIKKIATQDFATLGAAYTKITPIAVEITPLCNAAQKNGEHRYFLGGLMHPKHYSPKKEIKINKDYCYMLDKTFWREPEKDYFRLSFNLKLFHSKLSKRYEPLDLKLNDNLVIDLQHRVSSYISRPGHVLLE